MNINVLIEVAGVTNLSRDGHEMVQGLADGARRVESDQHAGYKRDQSAADGQEKADVAGSIRGLRGLVLELGDFVAGLIENGRRLGQPGGRILLEIKNLQVRNGGVAGVHLMRSEEHTSELQSRRDLVCRLLLEKKKRMITFTIFFTSEAG